MELTMDQVIASVIQKGAGAHILGGKKARGPLRTAEFIYDIMVNVALELTEMLPVLFDKESEKYRQHTKLLKEIGQKGKYTDTYGWSKKRDYRHDFSFSPVFFNYFQRIIVPFMGGKKKGWNDENSKIWKYVKKLIISNDKVKIANLQKSIKARILQESGKGRIIGRPVGNGTDNKKSSIIGSI